MSGAMLFVIFFVILCCEILMYYLCMKVCCVNCSFLRCDDWICINVCGEVVVVENCLFRQPGLFCIQCE